MSSERIQFGAGIEAALPKERLQKGTTLYIAGPLGFAESTRPFHEKVLELVDTMGGRVLDPWTLTSRDWVEAVESMPLSQNKKDAWEQLNEIIAENNYKAILKSSGMIANLDGTDVDSGTAAEIGVGFALGIPIIGYRGDFRLARDNLGGTVNLQVEYFVRKSAEGKGKIISTISDLPKELLRVWGEK